MVGLPLHHVALAVESIEAALPLHQSLTRHSGSPVETLVEQGVRVCFVGPRLELIEPLSPDTGVGRFIARTGGGLHHIAFASNDLEAELRRLVDEGFELIDPEPRIGAFGHRVAFLHPRSTGKVLVELVEASLTPDP